MTSTSSSTSTSTTSTKSTPPLQKTISSSSESSPEIHSNPIPIEFRNLSAAISSSSSSSISSIVSLESNSSVFSDAGPSASQISCQEIPPIPRPRIYSKPKSSISSNDLDTRMGF